MNKIGDLLSRASLLMLLACTGCVVPPPATPTASHVGDPATLQSAQRSLDDFCQTPTIDINRILQSDVDRVAMGLVCKHQTAGLPEPVNLSKLSIVEAGPIKQVDTPRQVRKAPPPPQVVTSAGGAGDAGSEAGGVVIDVSGARKVSGDVWR